MPAISTYLSTRNSSQVVTTPGEYQITEAYLYSSSGKEIEMIDKIVGFHVTESLHNPFLYAQFKVIDTKEILSKNLIFGGERIKVTVEDCKRSTRIYDLTLYSVVNREPFSGSSMTFMINACSHDLFASYMGNISKSYINLAPETIIERILREDLKSDSEFFYDIGEHKICCLIPNWNPMKAINWLSSRNQSRMYSDSPYRTFKTSKNQLYHVSVDLLYDSPVVSELYWMINKSSVDGSIRSQNDPRMERHLYSFTGFKMIDSNDAIKNLSDGMFYAKTQIVDIFERIETTTEFEYNKDFSKTKHLGPRPVSIDPRFEHRGNSNWTTHARHAGLFSQEDPESTTEKFVSAHRSKNQQTKTFSITAVLPGHNDFYIGQKYLINIPKYGNVQSSNSFQDIDELLSGHFLVDTVRHEYLPNFEHKMTFTAYRDALS